MKNLKIRVNNKAESKEVMSLLDMAGYTKGIIDNISKPCWIAVLDGKEYSDYMLSKSTWYTANPKEITLPELRDLVVLKRNDKKDRNVIDPEYDDANLYLDSKSDLFVFHLPTQTWKESDLNNDPEVLARLQPIEKNMKEYLDKKPDGSYELIFSNGGCIDRDWIEIPEGMNFAYKDDMYTHFTKMEMGYRDAEIIWQREQDEPFLTPECTLNDQYAEIEQVRQVEIHGTVKAELDFNFGAAQASGGVDATLAERQSTYGCFEDVAFVTENIMSILAKVRVNGLDDLPNTHRMALYMIASKMARIVNGDFNHLDSWHDIGGYSKLIEKLIKGE